MSTADNRKIKPDRFTGSFVFIQSFWQKCGYFSPVDVGPMPNSVSVSEVLLPPSSNLFSYQSCLVDRYPIFNRVRKQPANSDVEFAPPVIGAGATIDTNSLERDSKKREGIVTPERAKPFLATSRFEGEVKNSQEKKQNNIVNYTDFKGYWMAITCQ